MNEPLRGQGLSRQVFRHELALVIDRIGENCGCSGRSDGQQTRSRGGRPDHSLHKLPSAAISCDREAISAASFDQSQDRRSKMRGGFDASYGQRRVLKTSVGPWSQI